jgi:dynein heavy chain
MTMMILDGDGRVDHKELNFFLKGNTSLDEVTVAKPGPWITDGGWKDIQSMDSIGENL